MKPFTVDEKLIAASGIGFFLWFLLRRARALSASTVVTETRTPIDTSSVGPVEQVGGIGNVLVPRPGEVTNVDASPVYDPDVASFCMCAPLNSFGPKCAGYTWLPMPSIYGGTYPMELRSKLSVQCRN